MLAVVPGLYVALAFCRGERDWINRGRNRLHARSESSHLFHHGKWTQPLDGAFIPVQA